MGDGRTQDGGVGGGGSRLREVAVEGCPSQDLCQLPEVGAFWNMREQWG